MKFSYLVGAVLLSAFAALAGACAAEDDPNEGRVPLRISAKDPDGGPLTFTWIQKEGPPVKIADPRAVRKDEATGKYVSETYFVPTEAGNYVFNVTIRNEGGLEVTKSYTQAVLPPTPLPVANPGNDQKRKVNEKVVLSGVDSKAANNRTITKYEWTVKGAPDGFSLTPEQRASRQFEFVPKAPGKYLFELKVFDGKQWGEPNPVEVVITSPKPIQVDPIDEGPGTELPPRPGVGAAPVRPKSVAVVSDNGGKPYRIGDTIVLDGSKSVVSEGDTPRFVWEQIDDEKSPFVRVISPDTSKPFSDKRNDKLNFPVQNFVPKENGMYKFALRITTKDGDFRSDPIVIQVGSPSVGNPDPAPPVSAGPVARITVQKTEASVGEEITLDGSKSSSPDGAKLTYIWTQVPGKKFPDIRGVDGPVARFSAEREGDYTIVLVVTDGKKQGTSEPVVIKFNASDKPPIVELDPTQTCNPGEEIELKPRIKDPQNYPYTVRWSCLEPKMNIPIVNDKDGNKVDLAKAERFRFRPRTPGTYLFQIEVTNSKGQTAVAQTQIGVKDAALLKPTAVLNGPERAVVGEKITLTADKSYSPNKSALTYRWAEETEGGPKIKENAPNGKKAEWTFTVTEPGRYVVSLVVNDGKSESDPAKFAIDVTAPAVAAKAKPVAKISGPKSATAKAELTFSAENSTGEDLQYFWSQPVEGGPDLQLPSNARRFRTLRFTPMKAGTYTLNLEVMDKNNQRSESDAFTFEVKAAAAMAPTARANLLTRDPSTAGKEVRLSAEKSFDPGGAQLTYKWEQTKGPQELVMAPRKTAQEIVVTPAKPGDYELQLTVSNGELESAPVVVTFTVGAVALPQANIGEIAPPAVGDTVVLDGTASKSPAGVTGEQLHYMWKQKSGEQVRLAVGDEKKSKIQFVVPAEGMYVFELTVNDGNETSEPASITFVAKPKTKNIPPIAVIERAVISTEVGVATSIDATPSNDQDKGPEPLSFRWRRGANVMSETGPILKFTPREAGTLKFEVQAFDGKDYSQPFEVTVNVLLPGILPVAVPVVIPNPAKAAKRGGAGGANQADIIILDGTKSKPPEKNLSYVWRQVGGDNLKLAPTALAKDRVGIRIYRAGDYKFELVVSDNENSSVPVTVDLKVVDDEAAEK